MRIIKALQSISAPAPPLKRSRYRKHSRELQCLEGDWRKSGDAELHRLGCRARDNLRRGA